MKKRIQGILLFVALCAGFGWPQTNIRANNGNFTGALTAQSVNGKLCVGASPCYANVAAAVAAAGSVNKTIIEIESAPNYTGTDCGVAQANIIYIDYRGMNPPCNANTSLLFLPSTAAVSQYGLENNLFVTSPTANTSITALQSSTAITGTLSGGGGLVDGLSATANTTGATSGTLGTLRGIEIAAFVNGSGGAVTIAEGGAGYVAGNGASTTTIGTVYGWRGIGCNGQTYGVAPTNCYGLYGATQQAKASTRNYSIGLEGLGIWRYDSVAGAAGMDIENTAGAVSTFIKLTSGSNVLIEQPTATNGVFLVDLNGVTRAGYTTSGFEIANIQNNVGLQILNTTTTCTTAASVGATCTTGAITLPSAEPDTAYKISCTGKGLTNVPVVIATTNSSATQFTITIAALTAAAASFASYDCIVGHN